MMDKANSIFFKEESSQKDFQDTTLRYENIPLSYSWILRKWPIDKQLHYDIQLDINKNDIINEIKYEIEIKRIQNDQDNNVIFEINRITDIYINEITPDLLYDKLAHITGSVLYPLSITIDSNNEVLSIANHDEILTRWQSIKNKINQDFEGELVNHYLLRMESLLKSKDQITLALRKNDWFLNIFFKPIYRNYAENIKEEENKWHFPILESLNYYFKLEQVLNTNYNHFGAIEITHQATLETDEELSSMTGQYTGRYVLHPRLRHIIALIGEWSVIEDSNNTIIIAKLFCLPPQGKDIDHDFIQDYESHNKPILKDETSNHKKVGFWKKLFS